MLKHSLFLLPAIVLGITLLQAQSGHWRDFNLSVHEDDAQHCADLGAETHAGELAQSTESFTIPRGQAPTLEISGMGRGNIRVLGSPQADFAVEVCKFAVAADRATAEQIVRGLAVQRSGARLSASGPANADGDWSTYLIVHAPKDAPVDLETTNGAISVRGLDGQVKAHATNGPIALRDCGGHVEATTVNGPIAFEGGGGDIHLQAKNGPISVKVSGDLWNGNQLEAETNNGPLSLKLPDNFRSGVRVESSGNSPMSCQALACTNASSVRESGRRVLQMNGSQGTIHVTTHNGPVAVGGETKQPRVI